MFLVPMGSTKYSKLSTDEVDDREKTQSTSSTIDYIGFFFRRYTRLLVEIIGVAILLYLIAYIRSAKFLGHAPIAYSVLPKGRHEFIPYTNYGTRSSDSNFTPDLRQPPSLVKTFDGDSDYEGYSNATRHAWDSLMPSLYFQITE